jgi:hypothetical protein
MFLFQNLDFLSFQPKGDVLREPSNHLVSEWGIEKNNVVAVTTNSGAYIKNAVIHFVIFNVQIIIY